ncbi:MAG: lytic transglycosylase domain-containing protein, partial [Rhodospirillaceae bacterium]|nr:lytic transglycosylase domain-containing protein [Rhodospirillaceae bacterium]
KWSRRRLSRDTAYNIRLGSAYLAHLVDRFDGSYLLAAAAYNAGPGRVARWIARYGHPDRDIDPVDWIESVPFGETRNFLRRVLANVAVYRARLGNNGLAATPAIAWRAPGSKFDCFAAGACKKARAPSPPAPAGANAASAGTATAGKIR